MGALSRKRFPVTSGGESFFIPSRCTHRQGNLRCGDLNETTGRITCPLHHACFDIRTGRRLAGPDCPDLDIADGRQGGHDVGP